MVVTPLFFRMPFSVSFRSRGSFQLAAVWKEISAVGSNVFSLEWRCCESTLFGVAPFTYKEINISFSPSYFSVFVLYSSFQGGCCVRYRCVWCVRNTVCNIVMWLLVTSLYIVSRRLGLYRLPVRYCIRFVVAYYLRRRRVLVYNGEVLRLNRSPVLYRGSVCLRKRRWVGVALVKVVLLLRISLLSRG